MRKLLSTFLILSVLLNVWGSVHVSSDPVYATTVWISQGSSYEYYYFNITLEDIDVFGSAAMIGVTGLQGSQDIVLDTSSQKSADVFGDGTLTITLNDLSSKSVKITIAVDIGALATVASNLLENKIGEAVNAGLPQSKIQEYNASLKTAHNYINMGSYISAIDLCKKTMALIDEDIPLAKEAMLAIDNATLIINNPRLIDENCTFPDSVISDAKSKLQKAQDAFDSGDFKSAKTLAEEAVQIIKDHCKSCRIYPEKEKEITAFLTSQSSEIPLKPAWDKVNDAKREYALGNCVKAVQYLDSAKSLAEDIITGWNKASSCKKELLNIISEAKGKYVINYGTGGGRIQIILTDIENKIYPEITQYMKKGYFSTAVTNCNALKTEVSNRINAFNSTWSQMNVSYSVLMSLQARGYKLDDAWAAYNRAIALFSNGSYTAASIEFEKARNIAEQIKKQADEAQIWKNKTEACLLNLKMNGVNVDAIFRKDITEAEALHSSGKYLDAEEQWKLIDKKCHDPAIDDAIKKRKEAKGRYSQIKAEGIEIPEGITKMLSRADEYFMNGNFTYASTYYSRVMESLNNLEKTVKESLNEVKESEMFLNSSLPEYEKVIKMLGVPELKMRTHLLEELTRNASIAYASGNYSKVAEYASRIQAIRKDVDGDGIPDNVDILPQLPNYYIFGGLVVILLFLINMFK